MVDKNGFECDDKFGLNWKVLIYENIKKLPFAR